MNCKSDYLHNVLDVTRLPKTIDAIVETIRKSRIDFDAIAFRGMSGALIAPSIAVKLHKALIMVRKEKEFSHSPYTVEGYHSSYPFKYIIIDDLICSGETIRTIIDKLTKSPSHHFGKCKAVFIYRREGNEGFTNFPINDKEVAPVIACPIAT